MRRRWLVWVIGLPVYLVALAATGTYVCHLIASESWSDVVERLDPRDVVEVMDWATTLAALAGAAVIVATQAIFLVPIVRDRPPMATRSRPLIVSLVVGALLAAALTGAVAIATFELIEQLSLAEVPGWVDGSFVVIMTLASWGFWSYILLVFTRERRPHRMLGRLSVWLLAGTLIELLVVLPMDVMIRRRTQCYCWSGSYYALCAAAIATMWLTGPGVFIALRSRRRRLWSETHCEECGYEKGPQPAEACPECGAAWTSS